MTNEQKQEIIKSLAMGLEPAAVALFEGIGLKDVMAVKEEDDEAIQVYKSYIETREV